MFDQAPETRTICPFITSGHVAQLLGLDDAAAFMRQRARLETDHLFPYPMPTSRRPLRWKSDEVQAWISRNGRPCATPINAGVLAQAIATGKVHMMALAGQA